MICFCHLSPLFFKTCHLPGCKYLVASLDPLELVPTLPSIWIPVFWLPLWSLCCLIFSIPVPSLTELSLISVPWSRLWTLTEGEWGLRPTYLEDQIPADSFLLEERGASQPPFPRLELKEKLNFQAAFWRYTFPTFSPQCPCRRHPCNITVTYICGNLPSLPRRGLQS